MFKHTLLITTAIFATWTLVHASFAHAESNVEVNLDALDDIQDYRPPPMFEAPLTGYDSGKQEIREFPLKIKTRENSMNPQLTPNAIVKSQEPEQKNFAPRTLAPVKQVQPVEQISIYHSNLTGLEPFSMSDPPPLPKRKPYLRAVSLYQPASEAAKALAAPIPKKRPDKFNASRKFIDETITGRQPLTETSLAQPNAAEVLASIESNAPVSNVGPAPTVVEVELPAAEAPAQHAAKPPIDVEYSAKQIISFPFRPGSTEMDVHARQDFEKRAMDLLKNNPKLRIQIQAYATSFGEGQSSARRLSLTRAISIRSYLIERNIDPKRLDVRALGTQTGTEPLDRVDLVFIDENEAF